MPPEQIGDGIDENGIRRLGLEATRLLQREDTFHPAIALLTRGPLGAFAPEHPKASRAFSTVIGRFHTVLEQEYPERVPLAEETPDKSSGVIGPIMILVDQVAEPRIPRPPLPTGRWRSGHMTQALEFCQRPSPAGGHVGGRALRQTPRGPDEMRQARLALGDPGLVDPIAVTDEDASPVVDERGEGFFGASWMDHGEGHGLTGHPPQPVQRVGAKPRGFINIIDRSAAGLARNGLLVRLDGVCHAIKHLLDGAQAQGHLEDRGTKGLDRAATGAVGPGDCPHEGGQSWTIPGRMLGRELRLGPLGTHGTPRFLQHQMESRPSGGQATQ